MTDNLQRLYRVAQGITDDLSRLLAERDRFLTDRDVRARIEAALAESELDCARCKTCDRQVGALMEVFRDLMASAAAQLLDQRNEHIALEHDLVKVMREERAKHARAEDPADTAVLDEIERTMP